MKEATARSGTRTRFRQIAGFFQILLTEYRRAITAAALHEDLKRMNAVVRTREILPVRKFRAAFLTSSIPQADGGRVRRRPSGARHAERLETSSPESAAVT